MRALLICGLGVAMLLLPADRAGADPVGKGTYEVDFSGDLTTTSYSGSSETRFVLEPSVGYFVSDRVEVGVTGRLTAGEGDLLLGALGFASFHVKRTETSLYYLGLRAGGGGIVEGRNSEVALGAYVGEKLLVAGGRAAVIIEPFYLYSNPHSGPDRRSYGVSTGLSVFFH